MANGGSAQSQELAQQVEVLVATSRDDLRKQWLALFGTRAPRSISQPFLRRFIAFEQQLRASGGWPDRLETRLERLLTGTARARRPEPVPGGRLLREWNGSTHVVEITEGGYLWNGQVWRSLSAIAREITGAHWSGPRFFGLASNDPHARSRAERHCAPTGTAAPSGRRPAAHESARA